MTLKQCTKEELIYIVTRFVNKTYIEAILLDIEMKRINKLHNEVTSLTHEAKKADEKSRKLLEPYGNFMNVPPDVLKKARKLAQYSEECLMKAAKKMGVKTKAVRK